jgi:hypothetical protein
MKFFLLFVSLLYGLICFSQSAENTQKSSRGHKLIINDSLIKKLQYFKDSTAKALLQADSSQIRIDISRNMDSFLQLQKEQKAKQKKAAIIRIAIGISFLVLLIIGLKRRKK